MSQYSECTNRVTVSDLKFNAWGTKQYWECMVEGDVFWFGVAMLFGMRWRESLDHCHDGLRSTDGGHLISVLALPRNTHAQYEKWCPGVGYTEWISESKRARVANSFAL
jgi:hypothetical protein